MIAETANALSSSSWSITKSPRTLSSNTGWKIQFIYLLHCTSNLLYENVFDKRNHLHKVCYLPKISAVRFIVFLNFYRKFSGSPVFGRHDGSFLRYQSILAHLLDEISLYKVYLLLWVYNAPSPSNIWRRNDQWFFRKV